MSSIVSLEALSGVKDDGPLCYLLQLDDTKILLDCGWDENFDMAYMEAVSRRVPEIDAVLLSHPDIPHLGALPFLVSKCGLTCPIYATVPVYKMGQMFLYDWLASHNNVEDFRHFNFDDIDAAFDKIHQVKFNETLTLKAHSGLEMTPMPAGHMIGGALWRISKMGEEEIVYAVDFNHKKERHLNGCSFGTIQRPTLLITDAFNARYMQPRRKQRDEELVTQLLKTVRDGGDVLLVMDTAGRVLEIANLLDQLWNNAEAGLITYSLVMLSHVASSVIQFAKSQVEWMSDKIMKAFEQGRSNPFHLRHLKLCHSHQELNRVRSPKVVLVSGPDMESGFSRELFLEWSSSSRNCVIITGRSGDRTLCSKLIRIAEAETEGANPNRHLTLEVKKRVRLEGEELAEFMERKREREREEARKRLESNRLALRRERAASSDEESSDEEDTKTGATTTSTKDDAASLMPVYTGNPYDAMARWEHQQKNSFFKQTRKSHPVYAYVEEKPKWDEYGEVIHVEEYMLTDTMDGEVKSAKGESEVKKDDEEIEADEDSGPPQVPVAVRPVLEDADVPTKCIQYVTKIEVCFIDFEGRSDGESVRKLIAQLRPRQLAIVHGSAADTRAMMDAMKALNVVGEKVFAPRLGEILDATIESHIYQISLSEALMSSLRFQKVRHIGREGELQVKDACLTWIDARIVKKQGEEADDEPMDESDNPTENDSGDGEAQKRLSNKKAVEKAIYTLDKIISQAVFVNDPKLSEVKAFLTSQQLKAEFSSGVLCIEGVASIRRNEAGKFHIEGCASKAYFDIRDLLYSQFAIL